MLRKTTAVALKFFAISLLFQLILMLPTLLVLARNSLLVGDAGIPAGPILLVIGLVSAGLGLLAIRGILKVANAISLEDIPSPADAEALDLDQVLRYAVLAMGLYFGATALMNLPGRLVFFLNAQEGSLGRYMDYKGYAQLLSVGLRLVLAYIFITKSKRVIKWLKSF